MQLGVDDKERFEAIKKVFVHKEHVQYSTSLESADVLSHGTFSWTVHVYKTVLSLPVIDRAAIPYVAMLKSNGLRKLLVTRRVKTSLETVHRATVKFGDPLTISSASFSECRSLIETICDQDLNEKVVENIDYNMYELVEKSAQQYSGNTEVLDSFVGDLKLFDRHKAVPCLCLCCYDHYPARFFHCND